MAKFIPVIKHTDGQIEVFTSKFNGAFYANLKAAKLAAKSEPKKFWHCLTKEVAKMRAKDKICCEYGLEKAKAFFIEV